MKRIFALLLAAVSLISLTACAQPEAKTLSKYQLAAPQYPQMAQYPDETKFSRPNGDFDSDGFNQVYDAWQADRRKQTEQPEGYTDALDDYLRAVIPQLLTGGSGENKGLLPHQPLHGPRYAGGGDRAARAGSRSSPCWAAAMWTPSGPKPPLSGTPTTATTAR